MGIVKYSLQKIYEMGGVCSRPRKSTINDITRENAIGHFDSKSRELPEKISSDMTPSAVEKGEDKQVKDPLPYDEMNFDGFNDGIPCLSRMPSQKSGVAKSKQSAITKVSEVSSLLGRARTAGIGKAVDVLDTLGSSVTSLNSGGAFTSGVATKGTTISILAFEVANTIVKGANLMQSLSEDSITHLKEVVLPSEGVKNLISRDMKELMGIAAADKREELKVFSGEVVRFGNRCKDPQWHNLNRYFEKLSSEVTPQNDLKKDAEAMMEQLMALVQCTAELYHELQTLDRFEQDCQHKIQEEDNSTATQKDSLALLKAEVKSQKKLVRNLKKKSLWSRILEEVIKKLVDIVQFLHLEIHEVFGVADDDKPMVRDSQNSRKKLGPTGLALHYANIICQIDTLVSRSSYVPPNSRDALYHGLPPHVKSALRSKLQSFQVKEELTVPQIKAQMEKTLQWLVPIANNTSKAHHGFGWVGEWANTGLEMNGKLSGQTGILKIETLHHADKDTTERFILELLVWLHNLVSQARVGSSGGPTRFPIKSPIRSPNQSMVQLSTQKPSSSPPPTLTVEDEEMLKDVSKRKLTPGISKSQEFDKTRLVKYDRLTKSSSHSPSRVDIDRIRALDVIDRVDTIGCY